MKSANTFFSEILEISAKIIETTENVINAKELNGIALSENELSKMQAEVNKVKQKNIELFTKINENANTDIK